MGLVVEGIGKLEPLTCSIITIIIVCILAILVMSMFTVITFQKPEAFLNIEEVIVETLLLVILTALLRLICLRYCRLPFRRYMGATAQLTDSANWNLTVATVKY